MSHNQKWYSVNTRQRAKFQALEIARRSFKSKITSYRNEL